MPKSRRKTVMLDTGFLITLFDKTRPNHENALAYYKYFLAESIDMYLSSIVISEYQVKGDIHPILESKNFIPCDFHAIDGIAAGDLQKKLDEINGNSTEPRVALKDDIKLLGQCKNMKIDYIATEDKSTLSRYCKHLKAAGELNTTVVSMDAFEPSILRDGQISLFDGF